MVSQSRREAEGPFTLEQVAAKFSAGAATPDTHVWCDGMSAWGLAKEVSELSEVLANPQSFVASTSPLPPPIPAARQRPASATPVGAGEHSHLIELNPREVDDRTGAIDAKKLRAARKEAAQAMKVAIHAEKESMALGAPGSSGASKLYGFSLAHPS